FQKGDSISLAAASVDKSAPAATRAPSAIQRCFALILNFIPSRPLNLSMNQHGHYPRGLAMCKASTEPRAGFDPRLLILSPTESCTQAAAPTTAVDQSITEVGRTTCRLKPSSAGSSPKASPTSWGRCRTGM